MDNEDNCEQIYIETLGSIKTIPKIDELYNPEYECNLVEALKSKKNIIEKAKMESINRIVYKQKAKFARSIDSLANTDYQDTYQNLSNELNSNYNYNNNNNNNNSSINENYEDLKLFENCRVNNKNKNLSEPYNANDHTNINNYNKLSNDTFINKPNNNIIPKSKTSFMNNSILNKKLVEEKNNFENHQIGRRLKKLRNFDDIDDKIRFGYISVVPKSSLLYVNENKFLSYKEIKKETERKELEKRQKLRESSLRSILNPTPFQHFEITKNVLREKIKLKKDILHASHKSLLKNTIDRSDSATGTKRNSVKLMTVDFNYLIKDERNFMEISSSNKYSFSKTRLPIIGSKPSFNVKTHHLSILEKFNNQNLNKHEEYKTSTNYNKSGMRSGFISQYETDKMFQINSKYQENSELNILEETQNQDLSSLDGKSDCKNSKFESGKKPSLLSNTNSKEIEDGHGKDKNEIYESSGKNKLKDFKSSHSKNDYKNYNYNNDYKQNEISIIKQGKLEHSILNSGDKMSLNKSRRSSIFIEKPEIRKKASVISSRSKNLNSDLNSNTNIKNNNNDVSGLIIDENLNSKILQTIENNVELTNQDIIEDEKKKNFIKQSENSKNNNNKHIKKNYLSNEKSAIRGNRNNVKTQELTLNVNNLANSLDSSNRLNKIDITKLCSSKKANKINNLSFDTNKSISVEKENECVKYKKTGKRLFPNEPTFYGQMKLGLLNGKSNNLNYNVNKIFPKINQNKLDYVNAAKTTLNYLSNALKTREHLDLKKPLFGLNPNTNTSSNENNYNGYNNHNNGKINNSSVKQISKNSNLNSFKTNENYRALGFQEKIQIKSNKNQLEKIKIDIRKTSERDINMKELVDEAINEKVEIFKNILNSRDFIPQSEYDIGTTPKSLRPINYSKYKTKYQKDFRNENFYYNSEDKKLNVSENFVIKNGYSFTPKEGKGLFRYKEN